MSLRRGLTEDYVKKAALRYLIAFYTLLSADNKVHAQCEKTVQCGNRRGRTDITICYRDGQGCIITVVAEAKSHKTISSIKYKQGEPIQEVFMQLSRYPADERWVALSRDMLIRCGIFDRQMLFTICGEFGYGLLVVSAGNKVERMMSPLPQPGYAQKDSIQHYLCSREVIQTLKA